MRLIAEFFIEPKRLRYWFNKESRIVRVCIDQAEARAIIRDHMVETELVQELHIKNRM
jgi:hypothetical protein